MDKKNKSARVTIEIDETLLDEAMKLTGCKSKRKVVERGLLRLVQSQRTAELLKLKGRLAFRADYDYKAMRQNRISHDPDDSR